MYVLLYSLDNIAYGESVRYGFCRRFAVRAVHALRYAARCSSISEPIRSSRSASPEVSCVEHRGVAQFRQRLSGLNRFPPHWLLHR